MRVCVYRHIFLVKMEIDRLNKVRLLPRSSVPHHNWAESLHNVWVDCIKVERGFTTVAYLISRLGCLARSSLVICNSGRWLVALEILHKL